MYSFQLKIKSVNQKSLIFYSSVLKTILTKLNIESNILFLPKKIKKIILLKSPHVYKKAWEQFQIITYTSCIFLKSPISISFLKFFIINKPKTIKISIKKLEGK